MSEQSTQLVDVKMGGGIGWSLDSMDNAGVVDMME
jgi:hypothetical protein